jgi:tetratricopeptide (TPR) repeat protein
MKFIHKYLFYSFLLVLALSACVSRKKKGETSALGRFYHNTTAKYNGYFNANEILQNSISNLERAHKDNYSEILPVFPYNAVANADPEKANLDKAIQKVSVDISLHRPSHWMDDCYLILAKAQYLKKDFETAENSFKFLLDEFKPANLIKNNKRLREKSVKEKTKEKEKVKEEKKQTAEEKKKLAKKTAKEKAKAKERAKKNAKKKKGSSSKSKPKKSVEKTKEPSTAEIKTNASGPEVYVPVVAPKKTKTPNVTNVGSKLVPHRPAFWEASIWSAKNLTERGKYYEARDILKSLLEDPNTPEKLKGDLYATYAHIYLREKNYDNAIVALKSAVEGTKNKKKRARYAYILAQLYQKQNRPASSDEYYTQVVKLKPSYDLSFHAKMNMLINKGVSGEEPAQVEKDLSKLLKDPKNAEYAPELYFALAQIAIKDNRKEEGIHYLELCVWDKTPENNQKASAYHMLADLFFEDQKYQKSKYYFDSTLMSLSKNDERRNYVTKMVSNLKDIAEQLEIIALQDSLIKISKLSVKEKRALAIQIKNRDKAKLVQPEIDRQAMGMDRLQMGSNSPFDRSMVQNQDNLPSVGGDKSSGGKPSGFFAYDQKNMNRGKSGYEQIWGNRILEDNWRRSNKTSFTFQEEKTADQKETETDNLEEDLAAILKGIPSNDKEILEAHLKIQDAMFYLGVYYREKIEQYQKSKESHIALLDRYPDYERRADALYYLYLNCLDLNDQGCAASYSDQLKDRFPDSKYAKVINDPEYAKSLVVKQDEVTVAYTKAYDLYSAKNFTLANEVLQATKTKAINNHPLQAKIAMLSAMCSAQTGGKEMYMNALRDLVANFPGTPEESKAKEILRFLKGDNEAFTEITTQQIEEFQFKLEDDKNHYAIVVFFDPPEKQMDKAKIAISDYHAKYHRTENLKMSSVVLDIDKNISIILIRKFDDRTRAMKYYEGVQRNISEYIPGFQNYETYPLTPNNYRKILELKSVKEYQAFFKANYFK